jgi:3-oxoacyl-[acyl-carrier protein] reductase
MQPRRRTGRMDQDIDTSNTFPRLVGGVAVVTGAGSGIGREIAFRLAGEGAAVAVLDVSEERGEATVGQMLEREQKAIYVRADVTKRAQVAAALDQVERALGGLTVAVNNAGIASISHFLDTTDDAWSTTLAVNLTGTFLIGQEAARRMAPRRSGAIVNICSTAARTAHSGTSAYTASKGGVEALTRSMAFELAPLGIAVNAVSPGATVGGETQDILTDDERAGRVARYPVGRLGIPSEIAAVVAFFASPDAAFVRGVTLPVDGGYLVAGVRGPGPVAEHGRHGADA